MMMGQGADIRVFRNDEITVEDVVAQAPDGLVISPGPCTPNEAGISVELIQRMSGVVPLLGVCLGHQSICAAFGGVVGHAKSIMHGKTSPVYHENAPILKGMKNPFQAGRYHSLSLVREKLPDCLVVDAWTDDEEIMGIHHVEHKTYGVQFHPESVLTPTGRRLLRNFQKIVEG
jgi:anthranilate synthase component 2